MGGYREQACGVKGGGWVGAGPRWAAAAGLRAEVG
jgi:hypothetical protein